MKNTTLTKRTEIKKQDKFTSLLAVHNDLLLKRNTGFDSEHALRMQEILDNPPRTQDEWRQNGERYREAQKFFKNLDRWFEEQVMQTSREYNRMLRDMPVFLA